MTTRAPTELGSVGTPDLPLGRLTAQAYGGGSPRDVRSPVTGRVIASVPQADRGDVEHAFAQARRAQQDWARVPMRRRAQVMRAFHDLVLGHRDEGLDIVQSETGKARKDALEELLDVAITTRHYSKVARRLLRPRRRRSLLPGLIRTHELHRPKGVVGMIAPWNYPLTLAASDAVAALMAGNSVVLKPDSKTPLSALWIADMLQRAGLPHGTFIVTPGSGAALGPVFTSLSDYVMFTGSTQVGRQIARACGERLIGCSLELGGKNPLVVLDDADPDQAAEITVRGAFSNSGQLCVSIERVYVAENLWEPYVAALTERVAALRQDARVGWGNDVGSLIDEKHLRTVSEHVEDAVRQGARVLAGGRARPELGPYVYEPTVLVDVPPAALAHSDETFGPVVSLYRHGTDDEAVALANATEFGLNASVVAGDLKRGQRVAGRIRAGTVSVNETYAAAWGSVCAPMGGMGDSGMGRRHGAEGLTKYTESQTVATMRALGLGPQFGLDHRMWGRVMTGGVRVNRVLRVK